MRRVLPLLFLVAACDDPVGPQPDQPIRPPAGYDGKPPLPPGPPEPKPAPKPVEQAAPPAETPGPDPAPELPKCPADVGAALTAKAKPTKDKRKRIAVELSPKSKTGPSISFIKVVRTEDGVAEDVKVNGAELEGFVVPSTPKGKVTMVVSVACNGVDRLAGVAVDPKGTATVKELAPPPEPGYLDVDAPAQTKVSAVGKELGVAPFKGLALAPGKYTLKLQPAKGKAKTTTVEIRSGEHSTVAMESPKKK
jgi:hypothetical protein